MAGSQSVEAIGAESLNSLTFRDHECFSAEPCEPHALIAFNAVYSFVSSLGARCVISGRTVENSPVCDVS